MRNLKKVLSLVLCVAVMLSVMVVGAGAAFSDQKEIAHTEAVDMMSALNIIGGYPDGSFKPTNNVTRAEMTKMICVTLNGGKEPAVGTKDTPTFNDVRPGSAWAEGYIESCVAQGIVSGVGNGRFNPTGNVTGTQAAKMLLVALGFSSDEETFTGPNWAVNVNVRATQKGLYEELEDIDVNAALTREHAAQMIWNALQAKETEYKYTLIGENGNLSSRVTAEDKNIDLLTDKYGTMDTDDTTGILSRISYNTNKGEYTYYVDQVGAFKSKADYTELLGQNVCFVAKASDNVVGAYAKDSSVIVSALVGDVDEDSIKSDSVKIDGTKYDLDTSVEILAYSAENHQATLVDADEADGSNTTIEPYFEMVAIDNDDNDKIDRIIVYPVAIEEINYVGSDYVKFKNDSEKYNVGGDDYALYSGAEKDDFALVSADTTLKTLGNITELEKMTGKVSTTNNKGVATIDGSSYDYTTLDPDSIGKLEAALDKNVDFRVVNDYVVWCDASSAVDLSDYVLVTGVAGAPGVSGYYDASLLFTDGKSATAAIKSVDGANKAKPGDGVLYTYEMKDGRYVLTTVTELTDYDASTDPEFQPAKSSNDADAKIAFEEGTAKFATDAVVFVKDGDDYSVETGATLSKVTDADAYVNLAGAEKNNTNALSVTFAYIVTEGVSASDDQYGYVVSDISSKKDADGSYQVFTIWDGAKEVELTTADGVKVAGIEKGDVISYKLDADGAVSEGEVVTYTGAIEIIDDDEITIDGIVYTIDEDDTTILYVSNADYEGVASGSIAVATETEDEGYYDNVSFVVKANDSDNTLELLVVDIDNDWWGDID